MSIKIPIVGMVAWHVKLGFGSFFTMEFGDPTLKVREPVQSKKSNSPLVAKLLSKREVDVVGQWHLWVQHFDWNIFSNGEFLASVDSDKKSIADALEQLDGQRLDSISLVGVKLILNFDLGATVELHSDADDSEAPLATVFGPADNAIEITALR